MDFRKTIQHMNAVQPLTRRGMLRDAACGFGLLGLASLFEQNRAKAANVEFDPANPLRVRDSHFKARAKRVIFLFMHGGPSSVDTFEYKPYLAENDGKPLPIERPLAFDDEDPGPLMKPLWDFRPGGESGILVSDLFPHVRGCVDDMCSRAFDGGRGRGPWRRPAANLHGLEHVHAAEPGFLGGLWPRDREQEPAGLHHDQAGTLARRSQELVVGVPAGILPGHADRARRPQRR